LLGLLTKRDNPTLTFLHLQQILNLNLPHLDDCFITAFPAETTEAFLDGHVRAFAYHLGGVPTRILYDNTKIAVAKS